MSYGHFFSFSFSRMMEKKKNSVGTETAALSRWCVCLRVKPDEEKNTSLENEYLSNHR